jgi:hypothetical protein
MKSIIALIFIATVSLATPAAFTTKAHSGEPPSINRFDGVWDSYGGISCRRGNAEPEVLTIRNGELCATIQTTDNGRRMLGKIDAFGRMTVYVNGHYTLMIFKVAVIGDAGYGPAEAIVDDVSCDCAWALKRRADPSITGVHRIPDGATARIGLDFSTRAVSWNGQREVEKIYEGFNHRAENDRLKSMGNASTQFILDKLESRISAQKPTPSVTLSVIAKKTPEPSSQVNKELKELRKKIAPLEKKRRNRNHLNRLPRECPPNHLHHLSHQDQDLVSLFLSWVTSSPISTLVAVRECMSVIMFRNRLLQTS